MNNMNNTNTIQATTEKPDDFQLLTQELDEYTKASNELAIIEAEFQESIQELIAECYREDFAKVQTRITQHEERIEELALKHPEWFVKAKTLKTPYGSVASRTSTKLEVLSEDVTIALLEARGEAANPYLRTRKYLSLESLETLDDMELARLKLRRVTTEKITVAPAKVDLGKAVKTPEVKS